MASLSAYPALSVYHNYTNHMKHDNDIWRQNISGTDFPFVLLAPRRLDFLVIITDLSPVFEIKVLFCVHAGCMTFKKHAPAVLVHDFSLYI